MAWSLNPYTSQPMFNSFASGAKRYGANRSGTATMGPVDKRGYNDRERERRRRAAVQDRLNRMRASGYAVGRPTYQGGQY